MLQMRSILKQLCLLSAIVLASSQEHESDYSVDEGDDHSDFTDDSDHPDYSKYYSVDSSAPIVAPNANINSGAAGFVGPTDFYSFFGSPDFGASNSKQAIVQPKDPFKAETKSPGFANLKAEFPEFYNNNGPYQKDFFEESQRKQHQGEEGEESSDPKYISHSIPARYTALDNEELNEEESEADDKDEEEPTHEKNFKKDFEEIENDDKEAEGDDGKYKEKEHEYIPKYTNYDVGKSSSTVSQYPRAEGIYKSKLTESPVPSLTPYQKYSFQPISSNYDFQIDNLDSLITPAPSPYNPNYSSKLITEPQTFLPQATENIPSHLQDKKCIKLKKYIEEKDHASGKLTNEPMDCFVCEDPKSKTKYTQCSYRSAPEAESSYAGTSQRYSVPSKSSDGFRYKRYSGDDYSDPYEYVRSKSLASLETSDEPKRKSDEFSYVPEYYDTEPDKSFSEIQSEELKKDPGNCEKVKKDGMTCTICKNAKTGGNFEQCSYTSEPNEKKYAYVTEKKFDSLDQPEEGSESKSVPQTKEVEGNKKLSKNDKPKETIPEFGKRKAKKNYEPLEDYEGRQQKTKRPQREFDNRNSRRNEETREHVRQDPSFDTENYRHFDSTEVKKAPKNTKQFIDHDHFEYTAPQKKVENRKKPTTNLEQKKKFETIPAYDDPHFHSHDDFHLPNYKPTRKLVDDDPYKVPQHFADSTAHEPKPASSGTISSQYEDEPINISPKSAKTKKVEKDIDEYYYKFFPEFANEESRPSEAQVDYPSEESKQDVEDVLAEFVRKDRRDCKKAQKNGMTCYLCVDKKGIQHEECMYVSESKPKATHVAYHEVKHIKPDESVEEESKKIEEKQPLQSESNESKRKRFFKKASPLSLDSSASEEIETRVKFNPKKKQRKQKSKKSFKEPKTSASAYDSEKFVDDPNEPTQKTPIEFVVGNEEGAYSAETRPVYSKTLGVKLPKYMIDKSEFEKEFDEFASEY